MVEKRPRTVSQTPLGLRQKNNKTYLAETGYSQSRARPKTTGAAPHVVDTYGQLGSPGT